MPQKCIEQIFGINHKQKVVRSCGADDVLLSPLGEINFTRDYIDTVDKMISQINLTSNFTKQSKEDMACSGMLFKYTPKRVQNSNCDGKPSAHRP